MSQLTSNTESLQALLDAVNALPRYAQPQYNLLDNSYFRNPVNQRGKTAYTGAANYCIDRWKLQYNTNIDVMDGYIKLDGEYDLSQKNAVPIKAGQAYTIAARMRAVGSVFVYFKGPGEAWRIFTVPETWQTHVASGIAGEDIAIGGCDIAHINLQKSEGYLEIEWVAVYEGSYTADTLPEYQPKGYAAELAECQRYFERIGYAPAGGYHASCCFAATNYGDFRVLQGYKQTKRINSPTILVNGVAEGGTVTMRNTITNQMCTGTLSIWNNIFPDRLNAFALTGGASDTNGVYEAYIDVCADL